jgi:hypothetical protein
VSLDTLMESNSMNTSVLDEGMSFQMSAKAAVEITQQFTRKGDRRPYFVSYGAPGIGKVC